MQETFFTADTHFDHHKIRELVGRPFESLDEMNQAMIDNWNKIVTKKDLVYHLGDFAFDRHAHFQQALNGKKILIIGSHDQMPESVLANFTAVYYLKNISIDSQHVVLSHCAFRVWEGSFHGSWNFYGHSHGTLPEDPYRKACDVGVDVWNYSPVPWEILKKKMQAKCERPHRDVEEVNLAREALRDENLRLLKLYGRG